MLAYLTQHPNQVLTRRSILTAIWGPAAAEHPENLWVLISQLRKKLEEDPGEPATAGQRTLDRLSVRGRRRGERIDRLARFSFRRWRRERQSTSIFDLAQVPPQPDEHVLAPGVARDPAGAPAERSAPRRGDGSPQGPPRC